MMMNSRSDVFDRIKSSISMRAVAEQYGLEISRGGYIACPFHADKTPSLKLYTQPGRGFYCYGCNAGGSVIDFVMRLLNLDFRAATVRLAVDFGISIEAGRQTRAEALAARRERTERERQRLAYERLLERYRRDTDTLHRLRPETPEDEISDEWVAALTGLAALNFEIDRMEGIGFGR